MADDQTNTGAPEGGATASSTLTGEPAATNTGAAGDEASPISSLSAEDKATLQSEFAKNPEVQKWANGLSEAQMAFLEVKGFQVPGSLIDSYQNLESVAKSPEDKIFRIPREGDQEAWNKAYSRLGRPDDPTGYEIPTPEGEDPETGQTRQLTKMFHEIGLSKAQAKTLIDRTHTTAQEKASVLAERQVSQNREELTELKSEWGVAYDQRLQIVDKAADQFNISQEDLGTLRSTLGLKRTLNLLHDIGSKLGEDSFVPSSGGQRGPERLSPAAATEKLKMLKGDAEWVNRYYNLDKEAMKEHDALLLMSQGLTEFPQ